MNRITDAVTHWRALVDAHRMVVPVADLTPVEDAVQLLIDDAIASGVITPRERDTLRAVLARSLAGEADHAEFVVLMEVVCELRGRPGLSARFGDRYRVLHRRLI